ncbi:MULTISPECIES: prephenate dehydrogenase [Silvimonas]|uniref:prephenate dehydrogenase n=1 Tax=Silvimonas TaxID=300264 RepID=UPI0024B34B58|nr:MULTISPECIES: prephenate dehydrogenase/arogenate dehydrogenase family protein [Silvimonas]MDR3429073.1 prephenate dehydrogenase/arogenate dehydrogenase family protein [Silvimonas sp.]
MSGVRKLVLLGTGLIGGSFALALKRARLVERVVGVGRNSANLTRALELNVIDEASHDAATAVQGADLVLLGTPVGQMGALMQAIAPHLADDCIVTDGGSTKQDVAGLFRAFLPGHLHHCVPGHPIAGSDLSGAAAAQYGLFEGRRVVLTPFAETAQNALQQVETLWQQCGARVYTMTPEQHDGIFSAVSHVPHLLAFAYMNAVLAKTDAQSCLDFAATGFRDFTRIAGSHPDMWRDIALANRSAILGDLRSCATQLQQVIALVEAGDEAGMAEYFSTASQARVAWGQRNK